MQEVSFWPKVKSHAHYPEFLLDIATRVPAGKTKKVFENWDLYVGELKRKEPPNKEDFEKRFCYDVLESV